MFTGSPWNIYIVDPGAINIKGEERVPCHKKATVRIQPKGQRLAENDLDASIQGTQTTQCLWVCSTVFSAAWEVF